MALDHPIRKHLSPAQTSLKADFDTPQGMKREQFHAMGTTISLLLQEMQSDLARASVQTLFAKWEQTLSRFLPESELSQLNQHTGESVAVSDVLWNVLTTALVAARATRGIFDPTMLKQLILLGYDRSFDILPPLLVASTSSVMAGAGGKWQGIRLDHKKREVMLPEGVTLDFGGIAKGMAVDAALIKLHKIGVRTALINAGGDLAVIGLPPTMEHWPVAVQGKDRTWTIPLRLGTMATSGIARRHWQQGEHLRHHLLDPRTGTPVQNGLWSVTVVAARCEQAEIAAKVAFILGRERGKDFLHTHQLAGLLVDEDGCWECVGSWSEQWMKEQEL